MRPLVLTALAMVSLFPSTLPAGEFDWMVREFSRQSGVAPTHIPFFGLARFVVAVGHPAGASDLHLAIFENTGLDPARLTAVMDSTVGFGWKPMVRVRSRHGESTNIYFQGTGKNVRLLIGNFESGEATLVQVRVRAEELLQFVDDHRHKHQ